MLKERSMIVKKKSYGDNKRMKIFILDHFLVKQEGWTPSRKAHHPGCGTRCRTNNAEVDAWMGPDEHKEAHCTVETPWQMQLLIAWGRSFLVANRTNSLTARRQKLNSTNRTKSLKINAWPVATCMGEKREMQHSHSVRRDLGFSGRLAIVL
jgi:hypothetical protein